MAGPSRATQLYAEAIGKGELVRAGQAYAEALLSQRGSVRATQLYAEAVGEGTASFASQLFAEALTHGGPDLEWAECMGFINERFPIDLPSEPTGGGPGFQTLQTRVRSGKSQRIIEWEEELGSWSVGGGVLTHEQVMLVRNLYAVAHGPGFGFLFKDPLDYATWQWSGEEPGTATALDMEIGTGDGATAVFQLTVTRTYGGSTTTKTIYKPVAPILVGVNGVAVTSFTLDDTIGELTFVPRASATGTDLSFADIGGGQWAIVSTTTSWASFLAGDRIRVGGSASNDTAIPDGFYTVVAPVPAGAGNLKVAETLTTEGAGASVTVDVHPAPWSGQSVTWGGEYDKPVHFAEDSLPLDHRQQGLQFLATLVELRSITDMT